VIVLRTAASLPDWSLVDAPPAGLLLFRRAEDGSMWLAHPSRPDDRLIHVHPEMVVSAVLPGPNAPTVRAPADDSEAIMNLALAGFTVELIREDTT